MSAKKVVFLALCCALAVQTVQAAPILTVTPGGLSGGNRLWAVNIAPDPSLFSGGGGSLAAELAFSIDDPVDLLSVAIADPAAWPNANPGNNPFTGTVTFGTYIDLVGDRTFNAYGSTFFTSSAPSHFLTITTAGSGATTLRFGVAASGNPVNGARIAQAGQNFDGYTGVASVPEPSTIVLTLTSMMTLLVFRRQRRRA
jgi:hypothetical protein